MSINPRCLAANLVSWFIFILTKLLREKKSILAPVIVHFTWACQSGDVINFQDGGVLKITNFVCNVFLFS